MTTLSSIILTVCLTFVSGHPLLRSLRHVHDLTPVDECREFVGPIRCGIDFMGYQDSDVVCCNGTKCSPPVTHTSQEPDSKKCTRCANGGTPVEFSRDPCKCPPGFKGLYCQFVEDCGDLLLEPEGVIDSTFQLQNEVRCVYEIRTDPRNDSDPENKPGKRIILSAEEFEVHPLDITESDLLHNSIECPKNNRVAVYQTELVPGFQFRKKGYCGKNSFQTIVSDSHVMFVEVIHAGNNRTNRVRLRYRTVINERRHFCEASWGIRSVKGTIHTPAYPLRYPSLLQCCWVLFIEPGYTVQLNFTSIDIQEPDAITQQCENDQLMVLADKQGILKKFCGLRENERIEFKDPGKVFILLFTDTLVQHSGFTMDFRQLPPSLN